MNDALLVIDRTRAGKVVETTSFRISAPAAGFDAFSVSGSDAFGAEVYCSACETAGEASELAGVIAWASEHIKVCKGSRGYQYWVQFDRPPINPNTNRAIVTLEHPSAHSLEDIAARFKGERA